MADRHRGAHEVEGKRADPFHVCEGFAKFRYLIWAIHASDSENRGLFR